jgi:serine/threonine-protein kinase HipA
MARKRNALVVLVNGRRIGRLLREPNGAIEFRYDTEWLAWENAIPISLSLPLLEGRRTGPEIIAFFDNLLPDNLQIRRHLAERMGATGTDAFSLLDAIGRDCVGALQFVPEGEDPGDPMTVTGRPASETEIEDIVRNLKTVPLGDSREREFRISIAGAQEKTALLFRDGNWQIPLGPTPTTHILKPAIGRLPNGLDFSASVENEHFCLRFLTEIGLPTAQSEIVTFGHTRVLAVRRFDRSESGNRILRLPQEDCCQALGVPWTLKYENEGGPGILKILNLLQASDEAEVDRTRFLTTQILFWLLGATDGHAKNFSIYLNPAGRFTLTPLYDVMSVQPNLDRKQIRPNQFKLAMAVGNNRHYRVGEISPRHFHQIADRAGFAKPALDAVFAGLTASVPPALERTIAAMPKGFPSSIAESIAGGVTKRLRLMT